MPWKAYGCYFINAIGRDDSFDRASEMVSNMSKPEYRTTGYEKFLDEEGYPATKPPWGTLNAVDLTTGKIKWKVPLGEYAIKRLES